MMERNNLLRRACYALLLAVQTLSAAQVDIDEVQAALKHAGMDDLSSKLLSTSNEIGDELDLIISAFADE